MNPMQMKINQIINSNPQAKQFYETMKGKSPAELKQYAQNLAQSKGINLNEFLNQYGLSVN
jgi:hypothetical protein